MKTILLAVFLGASLGLSSEGAEIAMTMDDPHVEKTAIFSSEVRNEKILKALQHHGDLKAALFVCGMRVDNPAGKKLLRQWNNRGHLIANHSYSHTNLNSKKTVLADYVEDFKKGEKLISKFSGFKKFFRFPFLKEGDTKEKRDEMRKALKAAGYSNGYVTIDASDWYVSQRIEEALKANPKADLTRYRDFYLKHIWDRATFYDGLAKMLLKREVRHTLLIHHNLVNALYLDDLLKMFESKGWKLISAAEAYKDPLSEMSPNILPAGESLVWGLAKESGKFESMLRYPGEDGDYEKEAMTKL